MPVELQEIIKTFFLSYDRKMAKNTSARSSKRVYPKHPKGIRCHVIYNLHSTNVQYPLNGLLGSLFKYILYHLSSTTTTTTTTTTTKPIDSFFAVVSLQCKIISWPFPDKNTTCFPWLHCNPLSTKVSREEPIQNMRTTNRDWLRSQKGVSLFHFAAGYPAATYSL